jgi:tRNA(Ile2)-agmatinylcytidine synthase
VLVAIDDTDGPEGGCTTYVATRLLDRLPEGASRGPPRLVRLDPDNPWKTRGNAAVVLDLHDAIEADTVLAEARGLVDEHARPTESKGAGLAVFDEPPAEAWYRRGVTERVGLEEARAALREVPTVTRGRGRGLVGCLCAAAWRPDDQATYTRLAYRGPERRGTERAIDEAAVRRVEREAEPVFDAWCPADEHALVAPRTPCPVLLGLRATQPEALPEHVAQIAAEPVERARTFVTNQASDDHLVPATLQPLVATGEPERLEGGHVRLSTRTARDRSREVWAFEPTGELRAGLRGIEPGDRLLALGSLKDGGRQVNAEKLLHVPRERSSSPTCPGCGRAMASVGRQAGYRCRSCGTRKGGERHAPAPSWHEANASARRHLARPLALGLVDRVAAAEQACLTADRAASTPSTGS